MRLFYSTSKALDKWLKADLPTLEGTQKGRNTITSDTNTLSWQLHIIENHYRSTQKTIIATEAYSRFTCFLSVCEPVSLSELHPQLSLQWQPLLIEMIRTNHLLPSSDAILLLSKLDNLPFDIRWAKNTDLSINGHITDAALWVTQTLADRKLDTMPPELAEDLAMYLNSQQKRIKLRKEKFIPLERLFNYCQKITNSIDNKAIKVNEKITLPDNVIRFSDYKK
ncbi:amino acid adenylation [Thalassotalea litorea]|uniref:amino acid adenylation n=1 Tax=Thalassotalea litorea TaxID=2020715 RepID=UPI0037353607